DLSDYFFRRPDHIYITVSPSNASGICGIFCRGEKRTGETLSLLESPGFCAGLYSNFRSIGSVCRNNRRPPQEISDRGESGLRIDGNYFWSELSGCAQTESF